jgi:hypothetical protein
MKPMMHSMEGLFASLGPTEEERKMDRMFMDQLNSFGAMDAGKNARVPALPDGADKAILAFTFADDSQEALKDVLVGTGVWARINKKFRVKFLQQWEDASCCFHESFAYLTDDDLADKDMMVPKGARPLLKVVIAHVLELQD